MRRTAVTCLYKEHLEENKKSNLTGQLVRILHVSSTSTISGANRYAFDLAAGQAEIGVEAIVAMPKIPGDAFDFALNGVGKAEFGEPRAFGFFNVLRKVDPDIVHCHDGTAARWLRFLPTKAKKLVSLHIRYKHGAMSHFDGVHALGDWQLEGLKKFKGPTCKVNNWVPHLKHAAPADIADARLKVGAAPNDFLIGFLGRLEHVKGLDILIEAFKLIKAPHVHLSIVGDGMDRETYVTMASEDPRIHFLGHSSSPTRWYGAFDLLVMPSRHEPFALVALEAMSCNVPILASDLEGFQEIFCDRLDCRFRPEDAAALHEQIEKRIANATADKTGAMRDNYDLKRFSRKMGVERVTDFARSLL